ncbi:MAG: class I SAM-dependent methyltransferase [Haloarculaceae archaeon]
MITRMTDEYHSDLRHLTWDEVYERQRARSEYVSRWFDDAGLGRGATVVELGSGPGYVAVRAARRVGPSGVVYAIDRQRDALCVLQRVAREAAIENVAPILADAEVLPVAFARPVTALLTYVLHHTDRPDRLLAALDRALPSGSRLFVCEYHPEGSGDVGPPLAHRIGASQLRSWLDAAGFDVDRAVEYENESYGFVARC